MFCYVRSFYIHMLQMNLTKKKSATTTEASEYQAPRIFSSLVSYAKFLCVCAQHKYIHIEQWIP